MADEKCCGTCQFYTATICRRHPPVTVALPNEYGGGMHVETVWPDVARDDWCGEWEMEAMSEEDVILAARKAPRAIG